jgi:hypothetical protein
MNGVVMVQDVPRGIGFQPVGRTDRLEPEE